MAKEPVLRPRVLIAAWIATVAVVLMAVAPLFLYGEAEYSAMVALQLAAVVVIIWTAAFAAENLYQFLLARRDEFRPLVVVVPKYLPGRDPTIEVDVHNFGRGAAVDLDVVVWWKDKDLVEWRPHYFSQMAELLRPGEHTSGSYLVPWIRFKLDEAPVHLVFELHYRDAFAELNHEQTGFRFAKARDQHRFMRVRASSVPSLVEGGKAEVLRQYADTLELDFDLKNHGLRIETAVEGDGMRMNVMVGDKRAFGTYAGREEAVYSLAEDVEDYLKKSLRTNALADRKDTPAAGGAT